MDGFEKRVGCEELEERCDVCGPEQDGDSEESMEFKRVKGDWEDEERIEREYVEVEDGQDVQSKEDSWQDMRERGHANRGVRTVTTGSRKRARHKERQGRRLDAI